MVQLEFKLTSRLQVPHYDVTDREKKSKDFNVIHEESSVGQKTMPFVISYDNKKCFKAKIESQIKILTYILILLCILVLLCILFMNKGEASFVKKRTSNCSFNLYFIVNQLLEFFNVHIIHIHCISDKS